MQNRLAQEKSPYLLQHKDNPIRWYAWGDEAFAAAREQQKPIFLSVGYSTCHWCHVMAHESFEDVEVAEVVNRDFIAIKVDREERPDIDNLYMKALQALSGGGGWPMSVWLTPDGKPFFAGTYFPKYRFLQLLRRIGEVWLNQRSALIHDSEQLLQAVAASLEKAPDPEVASDAERGKYLAAYTNHFQYVFDETYGGFGEAPKFPQTMNLMLMMRQDFKTDLRQAEVIVTTTLQNMLRGGMFDHLRGGFHRYAVDREWLVPHFEKMLYDQALISVTLLEAHQMYGGKELRRATCETLDYVLREMTDPGGGFYAAQDADSLDPARGHKEEGFFATYAYAELQATLTPEELHGLAQVYGVSAAGHYEGRNILHLQEGFDGRDKARPEIASALAKLESLRAARPAPHLDDKIIVAWNGWMIWALAQAARQLNEPRYLAAARAALVFCKQNLWIDGRLRRFWRDGEARAEATAEDYTAMVHACLELSQVVFDPQWSRWAVELQTVLDRDFWDADEGGYFTGNGRDARLPLRTKDEYDGVTPGANSLAAYNLARLHALTGEPGYREYAERLFTLLFPKLKQYPSGLPFLGLALDFSRCKPKVAVCRGRGWPEEFYKNQRARFLPYLLWTGGEGGWPIAKGKEGAGVYVCEAGQCLLPARDAEQARAQLTS